MGDNLKEKMLSAVTWSSIDRFGQQTVQFVIGLILARMLTPDDYGLIGMTMIFSALASSLFDGGFGNALVRKKDADIFDYSTVFFFNISVSLILYIILFFSAPYIALFFEQPLLIPIARVVFLGFIFNSLYLIPLIQLHKKLDYKTISKVNLISTSLSGCIGILLVFFKFNVWALVAQQVSFQFFRFILFYVYLKWKPIYFFSFDIIKGFWSFSINLLGVNLLNVLFNNIYTLFLSKFYPVKQVGFYVQANKMNEMIVYSLTHVLGSTYSLFSYIQDDAIRILRILREFTRKISLLFPVLFFLIACADPLFDVLLTSKWLPSVVYFQILCVATLGIPFYILNINVLNSLGHSKETFRIEIIKKILIVIFIAVSFNYGITAILIGYVISTFISFFISFYFLTKKINYNYISFLKDIHLNFIFGIIIFGINFFVAYFLKIPNIWLLIIQTSISVVTFVIYLFVFQKQLYFQIKKQVKKACAAIFYSLNKYFF